MVMLLVENVVLSDVSSALSVVDLVDVVELVAMSAVLEKLVVNVIGEYEDEGYFDEKFDVREDV